MVRTTSKSFEDFGSFYESHERLVRSLIFQMGAKDELDDLVQQAFIKCWQARFHFRGDSRLKTWVARIAINVVKDHWRSAIRRTETADPELLEEALAFEAPRDPLLRIDDKVRVERALARLSLDHRSVLVLRCFQDWTVEEIAELTGEAVGTAKSRIHYAKARLRSILESQEGKEVRVRERA